MQQELVRIGFAAQAPTTLGMLYHYSFTTNHYSNASIRVTAHVSIFGTSTNEITAVEADVSSEDSSTLKEYAQQFLGYISMLRYDGSDVNVRLWVEMNVKKPTATNSVSGVDVILTTPSPHTKMIRMIKKIEPATPPYSEPAARSPQR